MYAVSLGVALTLFAAPPQAVDVPKLTGERTAIARQLVFLRDLELQVGVIYVAPQNWRPDIHRDVIYLQSPQQGTRVASGTTVAVWTLELAADSQALIEVPDVRGKPVSQAQQILQQAGLASMLPPAAGEPISSVIDQFPRAGTSAYRGTAAYVTTGSPATTGSLPAFTPADIRPQATTLTPEPADSLTLEPEKS